MMNSLIKTHLLLFLSTVFSLVLVSCNNSQPTKETKITPVPAIKEKTPEETNRIVPLKIITTGMFHSDEVFSGIEKMQWIGLFKGKSGYYLKKTKIRATRVNDPVLDEEHQKTGWELSTPERDTTILLISSSDLAEGKISSVKPLKESILPGDTVSFRYSGVNYHLFATGNKELADKESDWYIVSDYKLYLSAKIDGKTCKTLLSDHEAFDDNMVVLIFAGDLDGDGIVDIILDDSDHYNVTTPTLFLSGKAKKGQLVQRIASHVSMGC